MISLDEASEHLRVLAEPTLTAFGASRQQYIRMLEATKPTRTKMTHQVGGLFNGVGWWTIFASELVAEYEAVGVARDPATHPLCHVWPLSGGIVVQLKSDTGNLPLEQLMFPELSRYSRLNVEHVVLTYSHTHEERFDPAFVQMDGHREAWRVPVAALGAQQPTEAIHPAVPKSQLSPTIPTARPSEQAGNDK